MPQTLVRASTIKLLDTYHRCGGQKVCNIFFGICVLFAKHDCCLAQVLRGRGGWWWCRCGWQHDGAREERGWWGRWGRAHRSCRPIGWRGRRLPASSAWGPLLHDYAVRGFGIFGTRHLWPGGEMLEKGHQWDCCDQNSKEPSVIRATRANWSIHIVPPQPGECGRVQFCPCVWVLPTQVPHMPRLWDAWAKSLRFSQTQQIQPTTLEVHTTNSSASPYGVAQIEAAGSDSCWSKAGEYYACWSGPAAVSRQGDWFRECVTCQQSCLQHVSTVEILQSAGNYFR